MASTENQQVKSRRELLNERLRSRYPDMDFSDEETMFGRISDDYDEYDKNITGYQEREKAFADMFQKDPRSAHFIMQWQKGGHPVVELIRLIGTDKLRAVLDDPELLDEISDANAEYLERVAKSKELNDLYEKNIVETSKMLEQYREERGLTEEQTDAAMALLVGIMNDGVVGKFTPESIDMALKAINHDADVAAANQEGLVQGKNTKVEETLRKPKKGDGVSALGGANTSAGAQRPRRDIGVLGNYGDHNKTIWERGNEKRRSVSQ